jgi:hypothetical protein
MDDRQRREQQKKRWDYNPDHAANFITGLYKHDATPNTTYAGINVAATSVFNKTIWGQALIAGFSST